MVFTFGYSCALISQDCATTSELTIVADGSSNVILNVDGLINNDLATNQSLCGVRLVFKHDLIENVRMNLVSPSGQSVTLVGPGRLNGNSSQLVSWNVAFVPCSVPPSPDTNISGVWDNGEPWAAFENYTGVYHPFNGCLEDFNMGSANGSWLLEIENLGDAEGVLQFFQLIFCDPAGSNCTECFLFAGNFTFNTPGGIYTFCEGDPMANQAGFSLSQDSIIDANQDYTFIYSKNDTIIKFRDSPNEITDLAPGFYELCGLSYQQSVAPMIFDQALRSSIDTLIEERQICADITEDCITLRILEIENVINIDTLFCEGDTIHFFGEPIFADLDTTVLIYDPFDDVCDSLITLNAQMVVIDAQISDVNEDVICGQSLFLNGLSSQLNIGTISDYQWVTSDGNLINDIGPIAEINQAGNYYLEVTAHGCQSLDSIVINQVDSFEIAYDIDIPLCYTDSFLINISTIPQPIRFTFNGPSNLEQLNSNQYTTDTEGEYQIISEWGTCTQFDTINLEHLAMELTLDLEATIINCIDVNSEITVNTNATIDSVVISGPENVVTSNTIFEVALPGFYQVVVYDMEGCTVAQEIEVIDNSENPQVVITDISKQCSGPNPLLDLTITSAYDSLLWLGPNGFNSNDLNPMAQDSGTYTFIVYGTNGCTTLDSLSFNIINESFPISIESDDIDCQQPEVDICVLNNDISHFEWSQMGNVIASDSCINVDTGGEYQILLTNNVGCQSIENVIINDLRETINVFTTVDNQILTCSNPSAIIEIMGFNQLQDVEVIWEIGTDQFFNTPFIEVTSESVILLTVTDTISQCFYQETITIEEQPDPFIDFQLEAIQPVCEDDLGQISLLNIASNAAFDVFINGMLVSNFNSPYDLPDGNYQLQLIDENGCEADTSFIIEKGRILTLDLGENIETVFNAQVALDAQLNISPNEVASYNWSNSDSLNCNQCLNPLFNAYQNEEVSLEIVDIFGCRIEDSVLISVDGDVKYFVPNVFSPNDDGDNDDLTIYLSDGILKVFDFRILDRWGNLVLFHPETAQNNSILIWDGLSEGRAVEQGVYIYVAKLLLTNGKETVITGDITLIR